MTEEKKPDLTQDGEPETLAEKQKITLALMDFLREKGAEKRYLDLVSRDLEEIEKEIEAQSE